MLIGERKQTDPSLIHMAAVPSWEHGLGRIRLINGGLYILA